LSSGDKITGGDCLRKLSTGELAEAEDDDRDYRR
jgi:hypothetical protein